MTVTFEAPRPRDLCAALWAVVLRRLRDWLLAPRDPCVARIDPRTGSAAAPSTLSAPEIEAALARARRGDARAFAALHAQFTPSLTRLALRRTRCREDAEDCLQEAWLAAWRALPGFSGNADDLAGWLARIVINACIDRGRRERCRPATTSLCIEEGGSERERVVADGESSPERQAERTLQCEAVESLLGLVEEPFRTVLELDRRGLSYAEISSRLGVPLGTVRSRLSRGRRRARHLARYTGWTEVGAPISGTAA